MFLFGFFIFSAEAFAFSIDSFQGSAVEEVSYVAAAPSPSATASNFIDVSSTRPDLKPSQSVPHRSSAPFSEIWYDKVSQLYMTNIHYHGDRPYGTGHANWYTPMCEDLNSGDGANKWRLPSRDEGRNLYTNGVTELTVARGAWDEIKTFWTSEKLPDDQGPNFAWIIDMSDGSFTHEPKGVINHGMFCVR